MNKINVKATLGIIGFVIVILSFLYCYTNPNVWSKTYKVISDGQYVYVVSLDTPIHEDNYEISLVEINHVDYWNQNGFVIMGIGLATTLLGLVLDDTHFTED
jgi:hypothetical protein